MKTRGHVAQTSMERETDRGLGESKDVALKDGKQMKGTMGRGGRVVYR